VPKPPSIKTPVIVIGGANMDLKCRISGPEILATSNPGGIALTPGGVARNVAETLARLGLPTCLIAAIGKDALGEALMAETGAAGVGLNSVLRGQFATGSYAAVLTRRGELLIGVSAMDATQRLTPAVPKKHSPQLRRARLIMADCNLPMATLDWLVRFAAEARVPLALETVSVPKVKRLRSILQKRRPIFALFSNRAEIAAITGANTGGQRGLASAARWLHDRGVQHVALGLGAKGMFVSSADARRPAIVPSRRRKVVDVTGGGDGAVAGTLFGLLRGFDLARAAVCGQAAAALTVASERSVSPHLSVRALLRAVGQA
jgi:sugar/nucleoside kinase (ribokinase family)